MKKVGLLAAFAIAIVSFTSCTKKVEINGEKVELEDGIYAKFQTSMGDILVELNTELAPMTAANFMLLADGSMPEITDSLQGKPYFDGLTFHRVIPDFMIQGGDPQGNGMGGPGYQFPNEVNPELSHDKGVISMANSGPHTNGSQFFITVAETKQLDGGYSVFGKVLEGQSVADSISMVEKNQGDAPAVPVVMEKVTIIKVGSDYNNWDALAAFNRGKEDFEAAQAEEIARRAEAEEQARVQAEALSIEMLEKYPDAQTSATGLMYVIETVGNGPKPANGDNVNIHYAGYFADGIMFDTSIKELAEANGMYNPQREPYSPMPVPYGPEAQLIPGFKEGVSLLNVGGKAKLIIPPHLAYGAQGAGEVIPPHAWLIFDIELVNIVK